MIHIITGEGNSMQSGTGSYNDNLYSNIHDGFYIIDMCNNRITCEYNVRFSEMTGYENFSEINGINLQHIIHPEDEPYYRHVKNTLSEQNPFGTLDIRLIKKDRSVIYVRCNMIFIVSDKGYNKIIHLFSESGNMIDIMQMDEMFLSMSPILFKFHIQARFPFYYNNSFLSTIGYTRNELNTLSLDYKDLIADDDIEHFTDAVRKAMLSDTTSSCIFKVKNKKKEIRWISCSFKKFVTLSGAKYFIGIGNDITEQKKIENELFDSHTIIKNIIENVSSAIITLYPENNRLGISYYNDKFSEILGYDHESITLFTNDIAKLFIYPDDYKYFIDSIQSPELNSGFECRAVKSNGETIWITVSSAKTTSSNQEYYICTIQNINHIKIIEKELTACNEQYARLINYMSEVAFKIDFQENTVYNFNVFINKYKIPEIIPDMPGSLLDIGYFPDDYRDEIFRIYNNVKEGMAEDNCIVKFTPPGHRSFWAKITLTAIFGELEKPTKAIGTITDVSEQITAEENLMQEKKYSSLLTPNSVLLCMINLNQCRVLSCKQFEFKSTYVSERLFFDANFIFEFVKPIHPDEKQNVAEQLSPQTLWNSYLQGKTTISFEYRVKSENQPDYLWVKTSIDFSKDNLTNDIILLLHVEKIEPDKQYAIDIIRKTEQDTITGLYTKLPFQIKVDEFFEKKNFNGCFQALYLLDLDGFKSITNSFGYEVGDRILLSVAENLKKIDHSILLGRLFGDRFLIFSEDILSYDDLNITAKNICEICQKVKIAGVDTSALSGSVGVAFSPVHGYTFEQLHSKADIALYNAKRFGKNRYAIYINSYENGKISRKTDKNTLDTITGSINFEEFKRQAAAEIIKNNTNYNLYNFDIKKFRNFNHYFGYETGDRILRDIAEIIRDSLKPGEYYARIFADNFIIMIIYEDEITCRKRIDDFLMHMKDILEISEHSTYFSAGKVEINNSNRYIEFEQLIDCAIIAHRNAKLHSGSSCITFSSDMADDSLKKYEILSELKNAIKHGQICTYVQPQYDILRREYVSMEALVRWQHPVKGLLSPDKFITVCEENGFISNIDFCVLEQMCTYIRGRMDQHLRILPVAVNQSQITIHEPGYYKRITSLIEKYCIPPKYIELEVTESAYVHNLQETITILTKLKDYGFRISMDDFGTGYSSLNLLKDIPIDVLKIDKGFLTEGLTEKKPKEIIKSITNMAHNIDVRVVCEGVEYPQQLPFLEEIGCELVQGFLFGKPMPYAEIEEFIESAMSSSGS